MKNVSSKPTSLRFAYAEAFLRVPNVALNLLKNSDLEKGDALASARIAGIVAAKRTDELIPLCHPLPIHRADVTFEINDSGVYCRAEIETIAPTGVEMEALTAASLAALTLYDMLKPHCDPSELIIERTALMKKKGGKSHYSRRLKKPFSAHVIVLSDSVASGNKSDTAGRSVEAALDNAGFSPLSYCVLPDEPEQLRAEIKDSLDKNVSLIITVGGTGLSPRDKTVEVASEFISTEIPGMMEAARAFGQERTPYAMLSRGVAGIANNSVLLTFPGSRKGAEETLAALLPGLVHLFDVRAAIPHEQGYV